MGTTTAKMTERLRALVHLNENGQAPVRNHLAVTGPQASIERFLHSTRRAPDGGVELSIDGHPIPVRYEERRFRERTGEWVLMEPGRPPARTHQHEEHAEASFAFTSDEPVEGAMSALSEDHPDLELRYAWFRHRDRADDAAAGALWKAGRRVAESHRAITGAADDLQMAELVGAVDALHDADVAQRAG
jgi:hypothetical protein